jgi:hypothetical protein
VYGSVRKQATTSPPAPRAAFLQNHAPANTDYLPRSRRKAKTGNYPTDEHH